MNIALISSLFPPYTVGGAERAASQLALALRRLGEQVDVVTTCARRDLHGGRYRIGEWEGIRVWSIAPLNLYWRFDRETAPPSRLVRTAWHAVDLWNPSTIAPLDEVLRRIRPEAVNTHNIDGLSPVAWQVAGRYAPVIHTLHDCHLLCPRATMQRRDGTVCPKLCGFCRVYALYHRAFQNSVRVLAAPARAAVELHRRHGWTGPRVEIIRNAVDVPPVEAPGLPEGAPLRVLFLSRLEREKGCETLMRAVQLLGEAASIEFHLAGRGVYAPHFAELARGMRHVFWHGYVEGAARHDLLSATDVFLQLSECRENAPLALIEARRYGLYLVGTAIGGIPEEISGPELGQLIPPCRPEELSRLLRLLADGRDALRSARRLRLARGGCYGTREMALEYLRVFRSVAARSRAT